MILLALLAFVLLWCFFAILFFFVLVGGFGKQPKKSEQVQP